MLANFVARSNKGFMIYRSIQHSQMSLFAYPWRSYKTPVRRKQPQVLLEYLTRVKFPKHNPKSIKKITKVTDRSQTYRMPPLRHDKINFKSMSGNEILLNLENAEFFRNSELVNSLIELGKRKGQEKHDWEVHPYTKIALAQIQKVMGQLDARHISQVAMALDRLNINDPEIWKKVTHNVDRLAHVFDARSISNLLNVLVPLPSEELEDDVTYLDKEIEKAHKQKRSSDEVLQQLITVLPLKVKDLRAPQLVRVMEVCNQRNLGSERFFKEYLFFYAEKLMPGFTVDEFVRTLRVLGDQQFTSDLVFWNDHAFHRIYKSPLNEKDAQALLDALIALKVKCPELNSSIPINYLETLLAKFESIPGYADLDQDIKDTIVQEGDLPEGINVKDRKVSQKQKQAELLEQAQLQVEQESIESQKQEKLSDPEYIRKKELREARKQKRDGRATKPESVLYDSD